MKCSELTEKLTRMLDGESSPEESIQLKKHLAGCQGCAAEYGDVSELIALLDDGGIPDPPQGYWDSFLPRMRERLETRSFVDRLFSSLRMGFVRSAAITALVLMFAFGFFAGSPQWTGESLLETRLAGQMNHFVESGGNLSLVAVEDPLWFDDSSGSSEQDYSSIVAETVALEEYFDSIDDLGAGEDMYTLILSLSEESRSEFLDELTQLI